MEKYEKKKTDSVNFHLTLVVVWNDDLWSRFRGVLFLLEGVLVLK